MNFDQSVLPNRCGEARKVAGAGIHPMVSTGCFGHSKKNRHGRGGRGAKAHDTESSAEISAEHRMAWSLCRTYYPKVGIQLLEALVWYPAAPA